MVDKNGRSEITIGDIVLHAGYYLNEQPMTPKKLNYIASNFCSLLNVCKNKSLTNSYNNCDDAEKDGVGKIIGKIIEKNDFLLEQLDKGKIKASPYLIPLEKNHKWGENLIAIAKELGLEIKAEQLVLS